MKHRERCNEHIDAHDREVDIFNDLKAKIQYFGSIPNSEALKGYSKFIDSYTTKNKKNITEAIFSYILNDKL